MVRIATLCTLFATLALAVFGVALVAVARAETIMPRRIIALYDGRTVDDPRLTPLHGYFELSLNHLGYTVAYHDLAQGTPPAVVPADVAAVAWWLDGPAPDPVAFARWIAMIRREGNAGGAPRLLALGDLGIGHLRNEDTARLFARIGVAVEGPEQRYGLWARVVAADESIVPYASRFTMRPERLPGIMAVGEGSRSALRVASDGAGVAPVDLIVTGPEGGWAHRSALLREDGEGGLALAIDPFTFVERALGREAGPFPAPDPTTLSGRRALLVTIDGADWTTEGPAETLGAPPTYAGTAAIEAFLLPFPDLPMTLSLVTGDFEPALNPTALAGEDLARRAFSLRHVKAASRTRTAPRRWSFFAEYRREEELAAVSAIDARPAPRDRALVAEAATALSRAFVAEQVRGVDMPRRYWREPFDLGDETAGSLAAVGALTLDKAPSQLLVWSGDAMPFENALRAVRLAGAESFGGGEHRVTGAAAPAGLAPFSARIGAELQVYAPLGGDAIYTNFWTRPTYGFARLDKTLSASERPRRLKPFHIDFSVYAAVRFGTRSAVLHHLAAARTAEVAPLNAAQYARMVRGFDSARIISLNATAWRIESRGGLATLRIDRANGLGLDPAHSIGVIGARRDGAALYVSLDPTATDPVVALAAMLENSPIGAAVAGDRGSFVLDNSRWSIEALAQTGCVANFIASGWGPGAMRWRAPIAGQYRVEAADIATGQPVWWSDIKAGPRGMLAFTIPERASAAPLRVTVSGC